jgi:3-dehydroquinate synthase
VREFELTFRPGGGISCPVRIGSGALARLVDDLRREYVARPLVLISDDNVTPLHAEGLAGNLRASGMTVHLLEFPSGEAHKTRETKAGLEDRLLALAVGRDAVVLAVGGGVTGDLAGFVAATWHRGLPLIQVPTSLVAMVDASIGGKTGVDLPSAKNQIGAFHQPRGIYADVTVLQTLPEPYYRHGFAEVVKTAAVADRDFFAWLESRAGELLDREAAELEETVGRCAALKGAVVEADEREAGRRAVLNFGHTAGHALEAASGFTMTHGQAVSVGMVEEGRLAAEDTGFPQEDLERLRRLLVSFGLPVAAPPGIDPGAVRKALLADKKNRGGKVRYAPPVRIGEMIGGEDVTVDLDPARVFIDISQGPV